MSNPVFTEEQKKKFKRYEEIKLAIKDLETEAEVLKPELLPLVPEGKEIMGEYGVFTLMKTSRVKYSAALQSEEEELKKKKKDEVRMGIAEVNEVTTLRYSEKKEKDNGEV